MSNVTIFIKAVEMEGEYYLVLKDSHGNVGINDLTTDVYREKEVIWRLAKDSGIDDLVDIKECPGSQNIFDVRPRKDGESFRGRVKKDASGDEDYGIWYKIGNTIYELDPKLKVNT